MEYVVKLQETDQTFKVDPRIGETDENVKRSLAGVVPYIGSARLERKEKDGVTTITVTKSHAPKGGGGNSTPF